MKGEGAIEAVELNPIIGGRVQPSEVRDEVFNPAEPTERVGSVGLSTSADVDDAVRAAEEARLSWAARTVEGRARFLDGAASRLAERAESLALLLCREHGKTIAEAHAELAGAGDVLRWHAQQVRALDPVTSQGPRGRQVTRRVPVGIVGVIVPWNYPVLLAQLMLAPALLAGNCVVLKLPDHAPLTLGLILADMANDLPEGVLSVVAGRGDEVGRALTTHALVRKVAFTGSTGTGKTIMRDASDTLKGLSLELGGNDAALVLHDARLDADVARELVTGSLTCAGQVCYAPKRLYVHRSHQSRFIELFTRAAETIMVGDGRDAGVTMGPVNNRLHCERVRELLRDAIERGAEAMPLGTESHSRSEAGYFVRPHLIIENDPLSPLMQAEQFGPLVPVYFFDDEDEAVRLANGTEFGLAASVWSENTDRAFDIASRLEAGTVFVNIHRVGASSVDMPFGGFKQSGLGRGHGVEGIHEYTELQILAQREDMRE